MFEEAQPPGLDGKDDSERLSFCDGIILSSSCQLSASICYRMVSLVIRLHENCPDHKVAGISVDFEGPQSIRYFRTEVNSAVLSLSKEFCLPSFHETERSCQSLHPGELQSRHSAEQIVEKICKSQETFDFFFDFIRLAERSKPYTVIRG